MIADNKRLPAAAEVSVVIPTAASRTRSEAIRRCITSIRSSSARPIAIIAVANGTGMDAEVLEWLRSQPDVTVLTDTMPSAPNAARRGREIVRTPFFSFIDDDDEYLPGSTDLKLDALVRSPTADFVIANGYRNASQGEELLYDELESLAENPLHALFRKNWLASCNALFRSSSIGPEFFRDFHPYAEWTWLAYRLAVARKNAAVVDEPCCRVNETQNSLSQSAVYHDAYLSLFGRMLELAPDRSTRNLIREKMSGAWHEASTRALSNHRYVRAIAAHIQSLFLPGGWRYFTYTRRLVPLWPNNDIRP
ncbi:MAG: glycosyltransferase family 2 protein [Aromatoleum sp.]|jgi:hypothetical protein|uniref:glycosyltransferase family 2 protein n=1 Tax=Aromatoleum sp. TaxID=2307007 RepID=UPI00289389D2|nr:glycosyltransferase family 2 protein [Aromatoleum sp.]MDT3670685.1 glycosyltransferase family 2 protein [Aromatoleum sp.]